MGVIRLTGTLCRASAWWQARAHMTRDFMRTRE
jgi:hypothetical protein